jgi:predicted TIM-barrel fold metal-dependent hydrolase
MSIVLDADQHLYERPDLWKTYCDPARRHLAAEILPDELGYWRMNVPALGRRGGICAISTPGDGFSSYGKFYERYQQGLPSIVDYSKDLPEAYWSPSARVAKLDEWGIDRAICFFNFGMGWPRMVPKSRVDIFRTNMEAWNRWIVDVHKESKGRLLPVGTVSLRGGDLTWLDQQLEYLGSNGIKAALFTYGLIDGRRPSHPDHDRAWASFVEHGITPVLHVQDSDEHASGLQAEWLEHDDHAFPALDIVFATVGIQVTIADMILNGVFDRFPSLKVLCVEASATWVLPLLGETGRTRTASTGSLEGGTGSVATMDAGEILSPNGTSLDVAYRLRSAGAGKPLYPLEMPPSEYLLRNVRVALTAAEPVGLYLANGMEDMIMFGGDYPHPEGLASPREDFEKAVGELPGAAHDKFFGGNAAEALGVS